LNSVFVVIKLGGKESKGERERERELGRAFVVNVK
jgi:hypothetical protein